MYIDRDRKPQLEEREQRDIEKTVVALCDALNVDLDSAEGERLAQKIEQDILAMLSDCIEELLDKMRLHTEMRKDEALWSFTTAGIQR